MFQREEICVKVLGRKESSVYRKQTKAAWPQSREGKAQWKVSAVTSFCRALRAMASRLSSMLSPWEALRSGVCRKTVTRAALGTVGLESAGGQMVGWARKPLRSSQCEMLVALEIKRENSWCFGDGIDRNCWWNGCGVGGKGGVKDNHQVSGRSNSVDLLKGRKAGVGR